MKAGTLLLLGSLSLQSRPAREGDERLGRPAPSLEGLRWLDRDPIRIEELRGKTVLVRWWTDGCILCKRSAPAIRELEGRYRERGLVVLAFYHPKPRPRAVEDGAVKKAAAEVGLPFPLAVDADWTVLRRWWLDRRRDFTSVTFLLDREGRIRWIHPGGEFHPSEEAEHAACARAFAELEAEVKRLVGA
ncbi:MAG TPA: redoxin domain-containing protein [Planctomycetota bacterium]|nr:redoxin domain-containing protein [Planctomycetota bacterium]